MKVSIAKFIPVGNPIRNPKWVGFWSLLGGLGDSPGGPPGRRGFSCVYSQFRLWLGLAGFGFCWGTAAFFSAFLCGEALLLRQMRIL